jgi:hypothetical protein
MNPTAFLSILQGVYGQKCGTVFIDNIGYHHFSDPIIKLSGHHGYKMIGLCEGEK